MENYTECIQKLNVKEDDVILFFIPKYYLDVPDKVVQVKNWLKNFKTKLPYNNNVVVIPKDIDMKVIKKDDQKLLGEEWGL